MNCCRSEGSPILHATSRNVSFWKLYPHVCVQNQSRTIKIHDLRFIFHSKQLQKTVQICIFSNYQKHHRNISRQTLWEPTAPVTTCTLCDGNGKASVRGQSRNGWRFCYGRKKHHGKFENSTFSEETYYIGV